MTPHNHPDERAFGFPTPTGPVATETPAARLASLWRYGLPPDLDAFLGACGDLTPVQLAAVLRIDQRERWRIGEPIPAEDYLVRFPPTGAAEEGAIDLAYGEFLLRERHGAVTPVDEFLARFPPIATSLKAQIEFHLALRSAAESEPDDRPFPVDPNAETQTHGAGTRTDFAAPIVPGYEVLGELGRGGMGVVYKARHLKLNRLVALKVLLAGAHAAAAERERLRREATAAAALQNPHIVQIFEVGESEGCPFLVMELVEGGNLKDLLGGVPRPDRWSAELVRALALAVDYAHAQGVVHRDLKPANILLGAAGPRDAVSPPEVKITDFGLAKQLGSLPTGVDVTRTGDILGTPSYMSPEQATGKNGEVGPATDVYALGSVLYELLTGRPPFQADTPFRTLQQVAAEDPVSPSQLQRQLPRDLVTICLRCLQKEPRKRYATAAALADDLGRFLAGESILARPVGGAERSLRWVRRNPGLAALCAVVAALLVVIAVGSVVAAIRLRESAAERGKQADRAEENARERLWQTKLADARAARFSDRVGRRFTGAAALAEAALIRPAPELCDEAIAGMALHDLRPTRSWAYPAGVRHVITFSRDFQKYARPHGGSRSYSVRGVADDNELCRVRGLCDHDVSLFSPDGRFLVVCSTTTRRLEAWGIEDNAPVLVAQAENVAGEPQLLAVAFGPGGHLFVGHVGGLIQSHDLETRRTKKVAQVGFTPGVMAVHPTARQLAVAAGRDVQIRDLDSGKLLVELEQDGVISGLAWHPTGDYLAVGTGASVALWHVTDRQRCSTMSATYAGVGVEFNRGGDRLVGRDWNSTLYVWDPWAGKVLLQTALQDCHYLGFGRDDQLRVAQLLGGEVRVSELVCSPTYHTAAGVRRNPQNFLATVAASPRGRLLAAGSDDGVVLFDLDSRAEVGRLPIGMARGVAFDSSGSLWTNGEHGVLRWPVADDPDGKGVRVGPPERHWESGSDCQIACSDDGGVVAVASPSGAVLLRRDRPGEAISLAPHNDPRYVAVSPRGEWVATGSYSGDGVKIWNATDGTLAHELPGAFLAPVSFSPDGRWLFTPSGSGDYQLWSCGTWQPGPSLGPMNQQLPTLAAFSRDGELIAVNTGAGKLCLFETKSGRKLTQFQTPFGELGGWLTYSSESGKVVAHDWKSLHIWDLNATRSELDALGIPWEVPTPGTRPPPGSTPLRVAVVGPDHEQFAKARLAKWARVVAENPGAAEPYRERARTLSALGRYEDATRDLGEAIKLGPTAAAYFSRAIALKRLGRDADSIADLRSALAAGPTAREEASICNQLAWTQLMGASEVRDPDSAVALAARAVRLAPDNLNYINTLGVAYYRFGRLDESIPQLRRSLRGAPLPAHDLYFLAMCYRRLGDGVRAQEYYDQACYWMSRHGDKLPPHLRAELEVIQRESALLGLR